MATYRDLANKQMPSLADIIASLRQGRSKREQRRNPGDVPGDASGSPVNVSLPGEEPIRAQPVDPGGAGMQQPQQYAEPAPPPSSADQLSDPRGPMLRALMQQGLTYEQAMQRIAQGG